MAPDEKHESEFPTLELDAGWDDVFQESKKNGDEDAETNERPTLVPAFDIEAYARENADSKLTPDLAAGATAVGPATSARSASVPPPPVRGPQAVTAPPPPAGALTPVAVARAVAPPPAIPTPPATARVLDPSGVPTPAPGKPTPHVGVAAITKPAIPRPERVPISKPLPPSQPFSQRKTPAKGILTPRNVAATRPEAAAPEGATPENPRARGERPTTLRVDQETLLALADKVAGSYKPAPAFDDPDPGPELEIASSPASPAPRPGPIATARDGDAVDALLETLDSGAAVTPSVDPADDPAAEMRDRFALGDYSGALVVAESLLEENPTLGEALEYADSCRAMLIKMYTSRIGPLERIPVVEVQRDQMRWLSIDHRAGFVLSLVDGVSSLEMILDVSGMRELDALRILFELVQQRIISVR